LPACHTTSSLSASLTCSWHLLVFGATHQQTWLRHKRSSECSLEAHEHITQNRQDILMHAKSPNELNMPTDANWILVANKAHHPKQTEQIPARQGSKHTESATSLELLTMSLFLSFGPHAETASKLNPSNHAEKNTNSIPMPRCPRDGQTFLCCKNIVSIRKHQLLSRTCSTNPISFLCFHVK
jgi:hypothetical protein